MLGKGSNSVKLRQYNERFVLQALREIGEGSKSDLARIAHLTPAAVADIIDGLEQVGFVKQTGKRFGKRGTPSILYTLNPERLFSIGLKIGRRALDAVLLDFMGKPCAQMEHEYDFPDPDIARHAGNSAISSFLAQVAHIQGAEIAGIGIASPDFLGGWSKELGFPDDLDARWSAVTLSDFFDVGKDLPLYVGNDATSAALAELAMGQGRGLRDFMHISIDTFVGGGLVLDGKIHTGQHGNSAALGPLPVSQSPLAARRAPLARYNSLLHRASIYVLVDDLKAQGIAPSRIRDLDLTTPLARAVFDDWRDDCANALVEAIIAIVSVIDLEAIILDSILPPALQLELVAEVQRKFTEASALGIIAPQILGGQFGAQASPIGAATLPLSALLSPDSSVLMLGARANALAGRLS